ncbi:hypothetical protein DB32_003315 [Sandaracinus amylolyticus]|uniref:Uncharacterized protein n=1 Tax=Sandaracinus amylolyticus TaxID=927083 RepID=A0A0F6YIU3_9BACT|nr:hypothetical protein DB32_003315 [Sandaracinus amylolyticus]
MIAAMHRSLVQLAARSTAITRDHVRDGATAIGGVLRWR